MKRIISAVFLLLVLVLNARGIPVHCQEDTVKINGILFSLAQSDNSVGSRVSEAALLLAGAGEDDYYRTDSIGNLRLNVDSFTPLMFVNTAIALAKASQLPGKTDWNVFASELENIACRRGVNSGFPSIMYHSSDWIVDNVSRGNIIELTENYSGMVAHTKSLDDMTRNRNRFAALADSATFENVRMTEMGFRTHRIPALKKETIKKKEIIDDLRDGDIIILVPNQDGIDIYDMGIVKFVDDVPHLIHLSPQSHTVTIENESLERYFALMTKYFKGYRLIRVKE